MGGCLVQRSPTQCGLCLSVTACNNNPLRLQRVGGKVQNKKERKKKRKKERKKEE
jgi:hypothetical protein